MTFELPDNTDLVLAGVVKESELARFENILTTTLVEATVKDFSLLFRGGKTNLQADKFEKLYKIKLKPECGCEGMDKGFSLEPITGSCSGLDTHILTVGIDTWYIANIPNTNMAIIGYNGIFDITENIDFDHDCLDVRFFKHKQYKMLKENYIGPTIVNDKIKLGVCPEGSRAIPPGGVIVQGLDQGITPAGEITLYNNSGTTMCFQEISPYVYDWTQGSGRYGTYTTRNLIIETIPNTAVSASCGTPYNDAIAAYKAFDSLKEPYVGREIVTTTQSYLDNYFYPGKAIMLLEILGATPDYLTTTFEWNGVCTLAHAAGYQSSTWQVFNNEVLVKTSRAFLMVEPCV